MIEEIKDKREMEVLKVQMEPKVLLVLKEKKDHKDLQV